MKRQYTLSECTVMIFCIALMVFITFAVRGCYQYYTRQDETATQKVDKILMGGTWQWTFLIKEGQEVTTFAINGSPKIICDAKERMWIKYKKNWNNGWTGNDAYLLEVHVFGVADLKPGDENRGKFGTIHYHEFPEEP